MGENCNGKWDHIHFDYVKLPRGYAFVAICKATGQAITQAADNTDATTTAKLVLERIGYHFGLPSLITGVTSDEYLRRVIKSMNTTLSLEQGLVEEYSPGIRAETSRNEALKNMIKECFGENPQMCEVEIRTFGYNQAREAAAGRKRHQGEAIESYYRNTSPSIDMNQGERRISDQNQTTSATVTMRGEKIVTVQTRPLKKEPIGWRIVPSLCAVICCLTMMLVMNVGTTTAAAVFEPVDSATPIIFTELAKAHTTYDEYTMIYYVNISEYQQLRETIEKSVKTTSEACTHVVDHSCSIMVAQLRGQLQQVYRDDENLEAHRQKRFTLCEWCGTVQHYLYGTMDATRAREVYEAVNKNTNETHLQHDLMANQTTLFAAFLKMNNGTMNNIERSLNDVQTTMEADRNQVAQTLEYLSWKSAVQNLAQTTDMALGERFRVYSQIRRALTDARNQKIPELIPTHRLMEDIKKIATTLRPDQRLPVDLMGENPVRVFKFAKTSSALIENLLLIQITFPIAEREEYNLFKATPIPMELQNGRWIVTSTTPYFLMNDDHTKFIPLSKAEVDNGKMLSPGEIMYRPATTTYLNRNEICEWVLMTEADINSALHACQIVQLLPVDLVITILDNERFFTSFANNMKVWDVCENGKTERNIVGRNTITLDQNCVVRSTSFILRPHKTRVMNSTRMITPAIESIKITTGELRELATPMTAKLNKTSRGPIVIQDHREMDRLIQSSLELTQLANHEFNMDQLEYSTSLFTMGTGGVTILAVITITSIGAIIVFRKMKFIALALKTLGITTDTKNGGAIEMSVDDYEKIRRKPDTPHPRRNNETPEE